MKKYKRKIQRMKRKISRGRRTRRQCKRKRTSESLKDIDKYVELAKNIDKNERVKGLW